MFLRWILTNINYVHFGRSEIFLETVRLFFIWRPPYQRWLTRCLGPCVWFTVHCETCVVVWFHPDQCEKKWIECYQHNDIQRFDFFFSYIFSNINNLINYYVQLCSTLFKHIWLRFSNNTLTHLITLLYRCYNNFYEMFFNYNCRIL